MNRHELPPRRSQDGLFDSFYYDALVPDDHELMRIDRLISFSFVSPIVIGCYKGFGRPPIHPELMLRFCFLKEYANLSDVELMEQCRYNLLYRRFLHLTGNESPPDSSTMTVFRKRLGPERVKECLDRVIEAAAQAGLIANKRAHVDSTGIVGDIAIPRLRGLVLDALEPAIAGLRSLGEAEAATDLGLEHAALKADSNYWETKERRDAHVLACWELLGRVADRYEALMDRGGWTAVQEELILGQAGLLEKVLQRKSQRKTNAKRDLIASAKDPDARWSNREKGKGPYAGYKEHIIEDEESGVITEVIVTPANVDDSTRLQELVEGHEENVGAPPEGVGADAKYHTGENLRQLHDKGIDTFIAVPAAKGEKQGMFSAGDFEYDADGDCVMCPAGELAEKGKWDEAEQGWTYYFRKGQCEGCALRAKCSKAKRGRSVFIAKHWRELREARAHKNDPEQVEGQIRRLGIERTFAVQKCRHGAGRTRYRTLGRVSLGVYLNVLMVNLRRLTRLLTGQRAAGTRAWDAPMLLSRAA
jgi:IS5 family transposase